MRPSALTCATLACAWLATAPRPSLACDHATLQAFEPSAGEVLLRKRLPSTEELIRQVTVSEEPATCLPEESDRACKERLAVEHRAEAAAGQTVTVALDGPTSGVYALMKGSEGEVEGVYDDYAAIADFFESPEARDQELVLVLAEPAIDRAKRRAVVQVTEEVRERVTRPPGMRILYRPVGTSLEALHAVKDVAEPASIEVVSWQPQDGGVVAIELRCAAD